VTHHVFVCGEGGKEGGVVMVLVFVCWFVRARGSVCVCARMRVCACVWACVCYCVTKVGFV